MILCFSGLLENITYLLFLLLLLFYQSSNHLLFQLYLDAIAVYRRSFGTSPRTKDTARGAAEKTNLFLRPSIPSKWRGLRGSEVRRVAPEERAEREPVGP